MLIAEKWYSSGTFWGAAGVGAVLLAAVITAWVTVRVTNPKRRLLYAMPIVTRLVNDSPHIRQGLEVRWNGEQLDDPHVIEVHLISHSRRDIGNEDFNGLEPLRLDVGAPIIELLGTESWPESTRAPKLAIDGSALSIGPEPDRQGSDHGLHAPR